MPVSSQLYWEMIDFNCDRNIVGFPNTDGFNNAFSGRKSKLCTVSCICGLFCDADYPGSGTFSAFTAGIMETVNTLHITVYRRFGNKSAFSFLNDDI